MNFFKTFGIENIEEKYPQQIIYSLALIYNMIYDDIAQLLKPHDLTPGKFNILLIVKHQGKDQGISQVEIGKRLILTASNMAKLIDKLEKEGLLSRSGLKGDRRVNMVKITKKGSSLLEQVWEGYNDKLFTLTSQLSKKDQKILSTMLVTWFKDMKQTYDQ